MAEEIYTLELKTKGVAEAKSVRIGTLEKANLLLLDFPIFRIESAFAKIDEWTSDVTITYEKPFKYVAVVHFPCMSGVTKMKLHKESIEIHYKDLVKGYLPYTAIGMVSDNHNWNFEEAIEDVKKVIKEEMDKKISSLRGETDMKVAGAGIGGAIGGAIIEESIKFLSH